MHTFMDGELLTAATLNEAFAAAKAETIREIDGRYKRIKLAPAHAAMPAAYLLTDGVHCTLAMGHWTSAVNQDVKAYETISAWTIDKKYAPAKEVAAALSYGLGVVKISATGAIEIYASKEIVKNSTLAINLTWIAGL